MGCIWIGGVCVCVVGWGLEKMSLASCQRTKKPFWSLSLSLSSFGANVLWLCVDARLSGRRNCVRWSSALGRGRDGLRLLNM